jgi:hypothetical protein
MKTEITKIKGDWMEVASDCRSTVGKPPLDHEPSTEFKRKILIAEHSPIRDISVKWTWHGIKSWVATHWSRHKFEKYIKSQRSDRTGIPRDKLPQDAPVDFTGDANVQALIDTMRKRLCRQSSTETRQYAEDFKAALHEVEPEIADVLVPQCVYRAGCAEMKPCGDGKCFFDVLIDQTAGAVATTHIQDRYDAYNEFFYERRKSE